MNSTTPPSNELRQAVIDAAFALILDRNPVTKEQAATMGIRRPDGTLTSGVQAARSVMLEALGSDPQSFAFWLQEPEQTKFGLSLSVALDEPMLQDLASRSGTAMLMDVLQSVGRERAHNRSVSKAAPEQQIMIDLTDAKVEQTA